MKRFLRSLASRFTLHSSRLLAPFTLYAFLFTAALCAACGGDDKSSGGSSSGGSAKARVEAVFEEWLLRDCDIDQVCDAPDPHLLELCRKIAASDASNLKKGEGSIAKYAECYPSIVDSYEACNNVLKSRSAADLCPYHEGKAGFYIGGAEKRSRIFDAFPECGTALKDMQQAESQCGLSAAVFLNAPKRSER